MKNSISFFRFVRRMLLQVITGLLFLYPCFAFAATYTWDNTNNTLLIQLATSESITVSNAGGSTSFTLSSGVFTQSGGDAATGSGTGAIAIADADLTASVTINNTSAGAGTNNVSLSGSGSLSSTTITINVAQAGTTAAISSSASFTLIATTLTLRAATGVGTPANPILGSVGSVTGLATTGDFYFKSSSTAALNLAAITTNGTGNINILHDGVLNINGAAIANNTGNATYTTTGPGDNINYGGAGFTNAAGGTLTLNSGGSINHAGVGDDIRAMFVVLNATTGIGVTATPLEQSTTSMMATNSTSGDIVLRLTSTVFTTTGVSAVNNASTGNIILNRVGGTALNVTTATTVDGTITITTNGANLSLTGVSAGGTNRDVTASTTGTGNITVGSVSATGVVNLTAGGAIFDDGNTATGVSAPSAALTASTGIGTLAASLNTDLDNVEATTATGGVFLSNTGALTVGGVNGTLSGVKVTGASGAIQITSSGTMTISESVQAPGNTSLKTTGSTSDLVLAHGTISGVQSANGITTLESGHDILCGTAAGFGDASGQGTVLLAGNDIIIDAVTYVQANGMQGLSATAGRDFKILQTLGGGSVFNNNAINSPVTITTGAGGSFVLDQGSNGGVGANGGTIIINTDHISVLSGAVSTNETITLRPVTAGRAINLGTEAAGQLSLTDTELDQVTCGTLIIGSATSGTITVSTDLTRPTATNMQLLSAGDVSINGGGINTGGGTLLLDPGTTPAAVKPAFNGEDVTASALSFGSDLSLVINGTTPGNGTGATYTQLRVAGTVNLTGVTLLLSGTPSPALAVGEIFTIVDNDGSDLITGTFTGLSQGATISNFLGSGLNATISYTGGTGNDVVLSINPMPTAVVSGGGSVCSGEPLPNVTIILTGTPPWAITYLNSNGNVSTSVPVINTSPYVIMGAGPGTYTVTAVSDANGSGTSMTGSATVTVTPKPDPVVTNAAICSGGSYVWAANGQTYTTPQTGLTINNGCTANQVLNLTVNPLPTAGMSGTTAVCQNAPFPQITFTGAVGIPPYTFTYQINSGDNLMLSTTNGNSVSISQSTIVAEVFEYSLVSVQDANGCSQSQHSTATITVNAPPVVITPQTELCTGLTMTLSPTSGGTWLSSNISFASVTNEGLVTALSTGVANFTFTATATGCSSTTANVTIKQTPSSNLTASKVDVCPNTEVTLNPNCSIPTATVNWNPGAPTVTPAAATLPYIYKARCVANGCAGNETSVEVRTHRILVDMKDLDVGVLPLPIVRAVKDNLAPTNLIEAPVFPRRWTFIANGCNDSESAVFKLSGPVSFNTIDNADTYAMFANDAGRFYSLDHPNYGNGGSFPNGTYTLTIDLRSQDGVGGPFPKNRVATGALLATRTLQFTVVEPPHGTPSARMAVGSELFKVDSGRRSNLEFVEVSPNPAANMMRLMVSDSKGQSVSVSLIDVSGRALEQRSFIPETNQHQEVFEVGNLINGMYFLRVNATDKQATLKVMKVE